MHDPASRICRRVWKSTPTADESIAEQRSKSKRRKRSGRCSSASVARCALHSSTTLLADPKKIMPCRWMISTAAPYCSTRERAGDRERARPEQKHSAFFFFGCFFSVARCSVGFRFGRASVACLLEDVLLGDRACDLRAFEERGRALEHARVGGVLHGEERGGDEHTEHHRGEHAEGGGHEDVEHHEHKLARLPGTTVTAESWCLLGERTAVSST